MRKIFTAILFFISVSLFSQDEKRLALVIGNANYDKGELKNPVNDARLIASTLDSLDFDVILKENLATKRDMTAAIREFGSKRSEYDVAFVYYAGHGIQVDDENFLLPTKEVFEEEFDVMDYGVSVQNIMRYLRAQTNEVNILILDACRDNPFESNWNTTRSLKGGGLAKIPPPTGTLIAFSTDSGQTAPDGDGNNSAYTVSLAKNMLLEDTSIDQVFRNVRAEVLAQTDGMQRPVEATQLTGQTFYLKKLSKIFLINKINESLIKTDIEKAFSLSNELILRFPEDPQGYIKLAQSFEINNEVENSKSNYLKAIKINPSIDEIYICRFAESEDETRRIGLSEIYYDTNPANWEEIFLDYYNLNTNNPIANFVLGQLYYHYNPEKSKIYFEKGIKYSNNVKIPSISHNPFSKNELLFLNQTWLIYTLTRLSEYDLGMQYANELEKSVSSDRRKALAISAKAEIYLQKKDTLNAIKYFKKTVEKISEPTTLNFLSDLYEDIALRTGSIDDLNKAFFYINEAINQFENSTRGIALAYSRRSMLHQTYTKNIVAAISDVTKTIEIYYKLFDQPPLYAFVRRLKMYSEFQMYDYLCTDLLELKKLIADKTFTEEELDYAAEYLSINLNIDLNSFINKFEFQECLSTNEYHSDTFITKK
tara:strand:+ start:313 stop:2271 length:1959 start_codon:yes stop_codon:yes gene_type:complete